MSPNRADRRVRRRATVGALRLASKMKQLHDSGDVPRRDGEAERHYFRRLREVVLREERARRVAQRKAAHQQRLTNQRAVRAARRNNR